MESNAAEFPTTHWTQVRDAASQPAALAQLLRNYLPALRAYMARRVWARDDVDDLLQEFVSEKFLQKNLPALADESRGRFRSMLTRTIDHFVISQARQAAARKRRPDHAHRLDAEDLSALRGNEAAPQREFDIAWGREVIRQAIAAMKAECDGRARQDLWEVFETRVLKPILDGGEAGSYEEFVTRQGLSSPAQAANRLTTAKRMFERHLRAVVGRYVRTPGDIDAEIRELREILAGSGAG